MEKRSIGIEIFLAFIRFIGVYLGLVALAQAMGHPTASTLSHDANVNMFLCSVFVAIGWLNY
jgi:hypothetical protein